MFYQHRETRNPDPWTRANLSIPWANRLFQTRSRRPFSREEPDPVEALKTGIAIVAGISPVGGTDETSGGA